MFDSIPLPDIAATEAQIQQNMLKELPEICSKIELNQQLTGDELEGIESAARRAIAGPTDPNKTN